MAAVEEVDLAVQPAVPRLRSRRRGPAGRVWSVGDTVVAMADDGVAGLDPVTGATAWQAAVDAASCEVGRAVTCVDAPGTPDAAVLRIEDDGRVAAVSVPGAVRATDVGADVVVAVADGDAREVRRVPFDGTVRWATPVPAEALAKEDLHVAVATRPVPQRVELVATYRTRTVHATSSARRYEVVAGSERGRGSRAATRSPSVRSRGPAHASRRR
ncbi:MAG TPA: hypothetical protein VKY71_05115 [Actinotalea caeni]|uniref:hypothetical protein n=1 Tax=Actinotalea caeni TaxID=1348467 RepID=UPI002B4AC2C2|nr:hypothetical protein [Actinotalea caeni]HLV54936.1 hypothetical protein [Actinotalea caeni]